MTESQVAKIPAGAVTVKDELSVEDALARFHKIELLSRKLLKEGKEPGTGDYGIIPGTKTKVLFKAGAEKLCAVFLFGANYTIEKCERDGAHVAYTVRCTLVHHRTGITVASVLGFCSTMESQYRYRTAGRVCPKCQVMAITKANPKFGKGWFCWDKKGGCKATFAEGDASIESQDVGKIDNPDITDAENTVLKMGEKRAFVMATLNALGISSLFTQDMIQDRSGEQDEAEQNIPASSSPVEVAREHLESAKDEAALDAAWAHPVVKAVRDRATPGELKHLTNIGAKRRKELRNEGPPLGDKEFVDAMREEQAASKPPTESDDLPPLQKVAVRVQEMTTPEELSTYRKSKECKDLFDLMDAPTLNDAMKFFVERRKELAATEEKA